jgi:hypothetical protein
MSYNALCGVNKQWLAASQNVSSSFVRWHQHMPSSSSSSLFTSGASTIGSRGMLAQATVPLVLAMRKYPRAVHLMEFPLGWDLHVKPDVYQAFLDKIQSLSLRYDLSSAERSVWQVKEQATVMYRELSRSPSLQSLTIIPANLSEDHMRHEWILCYTTISSLLLSDFEKDKENTKQRPSFRFNDILPVICPTHGCYSYAPSCRCCHVIIDVCASTRIALHICAGCLNFMVCPLHILLIICV